MDPDTEEVPVIPFLDDQKYKKLRKMCEDLLYLAVTLSTIETIQGESEKSFLPPMPDPFPLPSLYSYLAKSTGKERRALFFRVARGTNCTYYAEVLKQGDDYHSLKILSTDFPIKIDDLNISAVIKADELEYPEAGTLISAVVVNVQCVERNLVLSTKPEHYHLDLVRPDVSLGIISYKDLPVHYQLDQKKPKKPLHEFIEKHTDLNTEDSNKILEYLGIHPKRLCFTQSEFLDRNNLGHNDIIQQRKRNLSDEYLKKGLQLLCKKETAFAAEVEFKEALVHNPKNVDALFNLGSLYNGQSKYKEALENIEAALELKPENKNFKDLLMKIIKGYLEYDESKGYDEKFFHSVCLYKLQGGCDKEQSMVQFYLEAILTLMANPVWLEEFEIKEWNAKGLVQNQEVVDMDLASDDGKNTLLESFVTKENFLKVDPKSISVKVEKDWGVLPTQTKNQGAQLKSQTAQQEDQATCKSQLKDQRNALRKMKRLVDYESEDNKSGSDSPSVEDISDSSLKYSEDHSSPKRKERISNPCRDCERSSHSRHRSSERSSSQRRQFPKRYDNRRKFRDEDKSRRRCHSRSPSWSSSHSRATKRSHYSPESGSRNSVSYKERRHGSSSSKQISKRSYHHSSSREKGGKTSIVKTERLSPPSALVAEGYHDLDKQIPSPGSQDPQVPQVVYPSYPSFKKKPAVSIWNEVLDMIEDVRKEGK